MPLTSVADLASGVSDAEGSIGLIVPDAMVDGVAADLGAAAIRYGVVGREVADPDAVETEFDQHLDVVPRRSPRASSSTTSCWSSPQRSWPASPTGSPACAVSTSA